MKRLSYNPLRINISTMNKLITFLNHRNQIIEKYFHFLLYIYIITKSVSPAIASCVPIHWLFHLFITHKSVLLLWKLKQCWQHDELHIFTLLNISKIYKEINMYGLIWFKKPKTKTTRRMLQYSVLICFNFARPHFV